MMWLQMFYVANNPGLFPTNTPPDNIELSQPAQNPTQLAATSSNFYAPLDSGDQTIQFPDSIIVDDTSTVADTVEIDWMAVDSTNRVKYFRYDREEVPYVQVEEDKKSKFFVQPSTGFTQRTVSIDSTGEFVEIREKTGGQENTTYNSRIPLPPTHSQFWAICP